MSRNVLGSGASWPGTAHIYITKLLVKTRVFACKLPIGSSPWDVSPAKLWQGIIWKSFSWPRPSSASECASGAVSPVPGHTNCSGTEFICLYAATDFHGSLVLKHAEAMVLLIGTSHCFTAGDPFLGL